MGPPRSDTLQLPPDVLLARMLFVTVTVSVLPLKMAPPSVAALLPEKVLLVTVGLPLLLKMAPPPPTLAALLPEKVLLVTVSVALLLKMAPPAPRLLPPEMVTLSSARVTPAPATMNTITVPPPLMVT